MSKITACPLDCYDACGIVYDEGKLKAFKDGHTNGFLCPHLNHYESHARIEKPRYKGQEISIDEALEKLADIFSSTLKSEILHYRGSGNFALMQGVTDHVMAQIGTYLTNGSLCDGAGEAGIIEGRGSNKNMPLREIAKSEVVVFWGRNPHVTSSHILPLLKDKTIIVIDPVKTKIAQQADLFIQIKPHTDIFLAMLLYRFLHIEDAGDDEFLKEFASEYEDYYELTQTIRIKAILEDIGMTLGQIGDFLHHVIGKKTAIVCGVGIQKYRDGADVMRAIDALAVGFGLFGKEGCGVAYLGNSQEAITSPFETKKAKRVSKVNAPFDEFKTVFIQGSNPLSQMPESSRVRQSIEKTENVIYFGLYENETSEIADLVIPAKTFLEKDDVRTSYSHNGMMIMHKQKENDIGISEYDLAAFLAEKFNVSMKSEMEYLEHFKNHGIVKIDGSFEVENRETIPYQDGFDTDDGEFVFLEEFEVPQKVDEGEFYLITTKSPTSLNSQFHRDSHLYLNSKLGFTEGSRVKLLSNTGEAEFVVKINNNLREDCVLVHSGAKGVNMLTSSQHSYEGKNAIFQENFVRIVKID
ncbi:molybdopterin-containing oxidoreductase family protein [Sulfurimonas paralvinellae]|uniref:Molybdopterin-dependent oxidoreductase n=1 Tax=Sulfurimonas paralvinellae TaxID=317658 RepID=A0A7M1B897_9BACT|nr:molybdopterin-dependent oxidoreductase [Sulfurimonas paralvinellae]QOP45959.1 molybdopterin-dependent oxidoreductase [Sulfurimonas paralvinellae]